MQNNNLNKLKSAIADVRSAVDKSLTVSKEVLFQSRKVASKRVGQLAVSLEKASARLKKMSSKLNSKK